MLEQLELKGVIVGDPEDLFNVITANFAEIAKYGVLFTSGDLSEKYLKNVNELFVYLIKNCGPFLKNYYEKGVSRIFSEEITELPETETTTTTTSITIEKS